MPADPNADVAAVARRYLLLASYEPRRWWQAYDPWFYVIVALIPVAYVGAVSGLAWWLS